MPITLTYSPLITQTPTLSVPDGDSATHCVHYSSFFIHHSSLSYTFSAKEKDSETGLSYFGSRYYSSDLSIWLSVDPMSDKYASLSPYVYCANNPVKLVDPNGEEIDWVERTIYGRKEIYYDRDVKSQSDVDRIYGSNSGVRHLTDGTKVGNGQYTVYNDNKANKYGVVKDANGNIVRNHKNIIYGRGFVLFAGVTDESLDPKTLHNNLMKTSYTGGNNPKSYNNEDNFEYKSRNLSEYFSMTHDQQYAAVGAEGLKGVFGTTDNWKADLQLAFSNAVTVPINPNPIDRARSMATAGLFAPIGLTKAAIRGVKKLFSR